MFVSFFNFAFMLVLYDNFNITLEMILTFEVNLGLIYGYKTKFFNCPNIQASLFYFIQFSIALISVQCTFTYKSTFIATVVKL